MRARLGRRSRIDPVQIGEHGRDRGGHAVEIEAIEADPLAGRLRRVMAAQELHEIVDVPVPPHPGRKPGEGRRTHRLAGPLAHVAVDGGGVRPVGFDGHDTEAVALDQAPGDGGPGAIELRVPCAASPSSTTRAVREPIEEFPNQGLRSPAEARCGPERKGIEKAARAGRGGAAGAAATARRPRFQIVPEPVASQLGDGLERAGVLEEVASARHDPEELLEVSEASACRSSWRTRRSSPPTISSVGPSLGKRVAGQIRRPPRETTAATRS